MKSRQTIRPLSLIGRKPRNPLVAPALMRLAGRHGGNAKPRQAARRDLQMQIAQLDSA
ncbi:hypothetical protein BH11PSE10_BH11PSE10_20140 [soil metagenome]